jgi:hypothetical protein
MALPIGVPCEMPDMGVPPDGVPMAATVTGTSGCVWKDSISGTPETTIKVGGTVTWQDDGACAGGHTVIHSGSPSFSDVLTVPGNRTFNVAPGDYKYFCGIHGGDPVAKTGMWGIIHVVP